MPRLERKIAWLALYGFMLGLFWLQANYKPIALLGIVPDLLLGLALVLALFAQPRFLLAMILPIAVLRAVFALDSIFYVLAFFSLAGFALQEGRRACYLEDLKVQLALSLVTVFLFMWLGQPRVNLFSIFPSALLTAILTVLIAQIMRALKIFNPLLGNTS